LATGWLLGGKGSVLGKLDKLDGKQPAMTG
jgi:hypothetical protein